MSMWKEIFGRLFKKSRKKQPRNGKWKEFNKQAILISEGHYHHDLKNGLWKQYYETGELLIEENYDKGVLHGRFASYHLNGRLLSEGAYNYGQRTGYFHVYDESGRPTKRLFFINNILAEEIDSSRLPLKPEVIHSGT